MACDDPVRHADTFKHSMYNDRDRESRETVVGLTHALLLIGGCSSAVSQDDPCVF